MVFLQNNAGKTHTVTARDKSYRVIAVPDDLFFGIDTVDAYESTGRFRRNRHWATNSFLASITSKN